MALIGCSFLPASVAADVASEVSNGVLRQQIIAGLPASVFILAGFVADVALVLPPLLMQLIFIRAFQLAVFIDCLAVIAFLLLAFALATVAQVYAFLPDFKSQTGALNSILMLNVVTGFMMALAVWILSLPFLGPMAHTIGRSFEVLGRLSPAFNLANAVLTLPGTALPGLSTVYGLAPLSWHVLGEPIAGLIANLIGYLCLAIWRGIGRGPSMGLDSVTASMAPLCEVAPEEVRAAEALASEALQQPLQPGQNRSGLVMYRLGIAFSSPARNRGKRYAEAGSASQAPRHARVGTLVGSVQEQPALSPLSISVSHGEILGVLGVSGSGKSVMLAALVGALPRSAQVGGDVVHDGKRMLGRRLKPNDVGYVPQENSLCTGLTVLEHTRFYGCIRGLSGQGLDREASCIIRQLDLQAFEESLSQNLSGGNQRKLHCACAMIGSPSLLCLDEPSAGLDPVARRSLWQAMQLKMQDTSAAVIATKSVDEAEALCSRLAILDQGVLRTIGSATELRARYSCGHELRVILQRPTTSEIYKGIAARSDGDAMARFVTGCVAALGGEVVDTSALAVFSSSLVDGPSWRPFEALLQELRSVSWAVGITGVVLEESLDDLLTEDAAEVKAELDARGQRIEAELRNLLPAAHCIEAVSLTRCFQLCDALGRHQERNGQTLSVADIFESIEDRKERLNIAEYAITQASLEHIFNQFVRPQT